MLDFLNVYLTDFERDLIEDNIYNSDKFNFNCNQINCIKIIKYLQELGISNIVDLLINRYQIFLNTFEDFKTIVPDNINKDLINDINSDYTNIDLLFDLN